MRLFGQRPIRGFAAWALIGGFLAFGPSMTFWASPAAASTSGVPIPLGQSAPAMGKQEGHGASYQSTPFTSRTWAGSFTTIFDRGGDFNQVSATWVQPAVTCEADNS